MRSKDRHARRPYIKFAPYHQNDALLQPRQHQAHDEQQQLQQFIAKLERRRAMLEQQREDIEVMLNEITFFENQCRKLLAENQLSGTQPVVA